MGDKENSDGVKPDAKDKHVKIQVEGEDEAVEGETTKKRAKRFQMPNVPRWWQAKIIHYARVRKLALKGVGREINVRVFHRKGVEIGGVYYNSIFIVRDNGGNSHCTVKRETINMQRSASSASDGSFWKTIELLAGRGRRRSAADAEDVVFPINLGRTASALSFAHPHVRARLEKHMGSNLVQLTDKAYMSELEERIGVVNEENLEKRISARVLDEMERLKRLILVGKTPLKECPPELYKHPVFVFWRMVNKEVAKASKKRADAYYRKLKGTQKLDQPLDEESEEHEIEEENEQLTPEGLLEKCKEELLEHKQQDIEDGFRFPDEEFALLKYETNDIKQLKNLTTVEEMYALADKIIGTKRV